MKVYPKFSFGFISVSFGEYFFNFSCRKFHQKVKGLTQDFKRFFDQSQTAEISSKDESFRPEKNVLQ